MFQSHAVGQTWRRCGRFWSCCGGRGLSSKWGWGCWMHVWPCWSGCWCLRLFLHLCWRRCPGRQTSPPRSGLRLGVWWGLYSDHLRLLSVDIEACLSASSARRDSFSCASWCLWERRLMSSAKSTIGDKIVVTFTFLIPYFVTVIPFSPPSFSSHPPFPLNNVVPQLLLSWGTNKHIEWGSGVFSTVYCTRKRVVSFGALNGL